MNENFEQEALTPTSSKWVLVLDVDGVLTDGTFLYDSTGKSHKRFGSEDSDALQELSRFVEIEFATADWRGIEISKARIERDMGYPLSLVPAKTRLRWIRERWEIENVIYMGDSFMDAEILKACFFGIAPNNASPLAKLHADFVTHANGGGGAVAEACFKIAEILNLSIPCFPSTDRTLYLGITNVQD